MNDAFTFSVASDRVATGANASDCVVSVGPIRATYGASIWIVVPDGRCGGCVSKV